MTGIASRIPDSCFASLDYGDGGVGQAEVIGFTGHRGSCKSLLMTFEAVKSMRRRRRCLSNMRIRGPVRVNGRMYIVQSEPLAYSTLLTLTDDLRDTLIVVDEINLWFSSLRFQKKGNELFAAFLQQIRKRNVTLMYSNQNVQWGDNRLRWQTDMEVKCRDLYFTPSGRSAGLKVGQLMEYVVLDLTGRYTGRPYVESQEIAGGGRLNCVPVRRYFESGAVVDAWESQMGIEVKSPTMVITLPGAEDRGGSRVPHNPGLDSVGELSNTNLKLHRKRKKSSTEVEAA